LPAYYEVPVSNEGKKEKSLKVTKMEAQRTLKWKLPDAILLQALGKVCEERRKR
jgi:hypothetical protein